MDLAKTNQKDYLYGLNEVLKTYKNFVNENEMINELGTQTIYELLKNMGEE